jgi:hypothetical protein
MANNKDAETYAEATIAAILTLPTIPETSRGHEPDAVIQRYKKVLQKLRSSGAFN